MKRCSWFCLPVAVVVGVLSTSDVRGEVLGLGPSNPQATGSFTSNTGFATLRNDLLNPGLTDQTIVLMRASRPLIVKAALSPTDPPGGEELLLAKRWARRPTVSLLTSFVDSGGGLFAPSASLRQIMTLASERTEDAEPSTSRTEDSLAHAESLPILHHGFVGAPGASRLVGLRKTGQPITRNRRPLGPVRPGSVNEDETYMNLVPISLLAGYRATPVQPARSKTIAFAMSTVANVPRPSVWLAASFGLVTVLAVLLIPSRARILQRAPVP